ncbi:MAG: collagenase-like PrtC family protease [Desulforhopalus sp.]|jgi:collagenase-like PrtC family protease
MEGRPVRKIELLAPAKDLACGLAAINHGADAVYIGGPGFSARAAAANSLEDIGQLVHHAHLFGAKVYVALNTIFDDQELECAVALCHELYGVGVDALIIQDTGLLESDLPPIALHSSTQMNNRTPERVRFWEDVGFEQVVLARELSLEQIRKIRSESSVLLEFFVHGALCVSYSGQCYISEVTAGRSANRGECAQFCRHKFDLKDSSGRILEKNRYLLSLKDLDLSHHLESLIDAGVSSLKIEGRLKDETYVKNITAYYRQGLDEIIERRQDLMRASSGTCQFDFDPDPAKSFNRGKTDYFLEKKRNIVGDPKSPKSKGKYIGSVTRIDKGSFVLDTDKTISNGDGLCFFHIDGALVGIRVNRADGNILFPKDDVSRLGLRLGMEMYRNSDISFSKQLARSGQCRAIAADLRLSETSGGLLLSIRDTDGVESTVNLDVIGEEAKNPDAVRGVAEKQLKKSGGTIFSVHSVEVDLPSNLFYPASIFNEIRRKGFARHADSRVDNFRVKPTRSRANHGIWPADDVSYFDNIANNKALAFYKNHGVARVDSAFEKAADVSGAALMTTKYCIKAQLGGCPKMKGSRKDMEGSLFLSDQAGEYALAFDCRKCEMQLRLKKE